MTKAEKILSGAYGNAVKALTLSALNWTACAALTRHPDLKQPANRGFVEDARDEVKLPELESAITPDTLDTLTARVVASYLLCEQMRRITETNERGQIVRPFEYLKPRTPSDAIRSTFAWRADMQAKELATKAEMMGLDPKAVAEKARNQAAGQNAERMAYALAEANSSTNKGMMNWDDSELVEILLDMEVIQTATNAAENAISRAKARIESGLWADVDAELLLFMKQ
jgi:hypothetical protein